MKKRSRWAKALGGIAHAAAGVIAGPLGASLAGPAIGGLLGGISPMEYPMTFLVIDRANQIRCACPTRHEAEQEAMAWPGARVVAVPEGSPEYAGLQRLKKLEEAVDLLHSNRGPGTPCETACYSCRVLAVIDGAAMARKLMDIPEGTPV